METSGYARVPRELIEHSLNVHPKAVLKKQRLQRFAHDKREAIKREIAKLLAAGFIKEVIHPEWVANPVLVKKKNNEWRMCVDYTDLNKHCPKDHFGLPRIDQVVDSTAGCLLLCFLHCYSGYHQIALKEEDQIKTAFITPYGTYAYKTMSFGLKNAGATYQRAIQMCSVDQLHRNLPRTAIKSQALVDFMAEWRENQVPTPVDKPEHWTMYFDGSLKLDGGGAGVLLISLRGEQLKYVLQIL
jgi:hypothetical protein